MLTGVQYLDANLVGLRRRYFNFLKFEFLPRTPTHCSLASNRLSCGFRHCSAGEFGKKKGGGKVWGPFYLQLRSPHLLSPSYLIA